MEYTRRKKEIYRREGVLSNEEKASLIINKHVKARVDAITKWHTDNDIPLRYTPHVKRHLIGLFAKV